MALLRRLELDLPGPALPAVGDRRPSSMARRCTRDQGPLDPLRPGIGVVLYVFIRGRAGDNIGPGGRRPLPAQPGGRSWPARCGARSTPPARSRTWRGPDRARGSAMDGVAGALGVWRLLQAAVRAGPAPGPGGRGAARPFAGDARGRWSRGIGGMVGAGSWSACPSRCIRSRYPDSCGHGGAAAVDVAARVQPVGPVRRVRGPDDRTWASAAALLVGIAGACMAGCGGGDGWPSCSAVGAMLVLAFYFLPTRVHERYLFPAIALLVPFAVGRPRAARRVRRALRRLRGRLLYALLDITRFELPAGLADWIRRDAGGVWAIGLAAGLRAVAWAWMLLVRLPSAAGGVAPPRTLRRRPLGRRVGRSPVRARGSCPR